MKTNLVALAKDSHRYVFIYDDEDAQQMIQHLGKLATDLESDFTWYDAALLAAKARRLEAQRKREQMK